MPPAIELHHISKTFTERNWKTFLFQKPRYTKALDDISLTVEKGEIMGLLGPNGAGKTTLIKILATLISPDSGDGSIAGCSLSQQSAAVREKIGMVNTNDRTFYWRLTGRENLDFFAALYNLSGNAKKDRIARVLQLTQLQDKADFRFMNYSAGQKQRLSIARAMLPEPEVILLDEATSSLDPIATREFLSFTKEVLSAKEQKTILWCTHKLNEADEICDSLAILRHGRLLHSGPAREIKTLVSGRSGFLFTLKGPDKVLEKYHLSSIVHTHDGLTTCHSAASPEQIPQLVRELSAGGVEIFELSAVTESLESIFTELVTTQNRDIGHVS